MAATQAFAAKRRLIGSTCGYYLHGGARGGWDGCDLDGGALLEVKRRIAIGAGVRLELCLVQVVAAACAHDFNFVCRLYDAIRESRRKFE